MHSYEKWIVLGLVLVGGVVLALRWRVPQRLPPPG